jgi:ribose transport system substrate-binding protein
MKERTTMSENLPSGLGRRRFLLSSLGVGAGAALTACTSNAPAGGPPAASAPVAGAAGANSEAGEQVTIGFSAPAADHGWIAAIASNAQAQADQYPDVTFSPVNPTNDIAQQIAAVQTLINQKVNALVILPNDGSQLTSVGRQAMEAGIPVINLDRIFDSPLAYRTWIGGDNYGMGVSAGNYIGERLRGAGVASPVIGEIAGIDNLPLTQQRSQGFADALATFGFSVGARQAADFTAQGGQRVTANLLQAAPKLDAVWNHDDDQGIGVLAAIQQAGRSEFFMVGGAGSSNAMQAIQEDNTVLKATVTYSPSMASSAVSLARLVAQSKGMGDLAEREVPASITLASATITKDNAADYLPLGFPS